MPRPARDITGEKFGRLKAIKKSHIGPTGSWMWEFLCECGVTVNLPRGHVMSGNTRSCGCLRRDLLYSEAENLVGKKFGRLTVVSFSHRSKSKDGTSFVHWNCNCDCGGAKVATTSGLHAGSVKSCGCLASETATLSGKKNITHGMKSHPLYPVWKGIMGRCFDPRNSRYSSYGGRGITVCPEWRDVRTFIRDMSPRPEGRFSIDRKDNDGDYTPSNCRWATAEQQIRNTRRNIRFTYGGVDLVAKDWAKSLGMRYPIFVHLYNKFPGENIVALLSEGKIFKRSNKWVRV